MFVYSIIFWFTNCAPCLKEIPELNEIVNQYQSNSDVVFVAIALDEENVLKNFLSTVPFLYRIISNGRFVTQGYGIRSYPTNVVIDRESKIYFHSTGFAPNTTLYMRRAIQEIKNKPDQFLSHSKINQAYLAIKTSPYNFLLLF